MLTTTGSANLRDLKSNQQSTPTGILTMEGVGPVAALLRDCCRATGFSYAEVAHHSFPSSFSHRVGDMNTERLCMPSRYGRESAFPIRCRPCMTSRILRRPASMLRPNLLCWCQVRHLCMGFLRHDTLIYWETYLEQT